MLPYAVIATQRECCIALTYSIKSKAYGLEIRLSTGHRWSEADDRAQLSLMLYFKSHANHHFTYHLYFSVTTSPVASGEAAIEDSREAVVTILHTAFIKVGNK